MALFSFLGSIRADERQEKRRGQAGGVKNRVFNFLDDFADVAEGAPTKARDIAVGAVRGVARVPETAGRSFLEQQTGGVRERIRKELEAVESDPATRREIERDPRKKQQFEQLKAQAGETFDSGAPTDPIRRFAYGSEPVETYQTRQKGYEKTLGESRFRPAAGPLAFLGIGATIGLDAPGGGIVKGVGKSSLKSLAKETTEEGVKKLLKDLPPDIASKVAPAIARTKDTNIIQNILRNAQPKPVDDAMVQTVKTTKQLSDEEFAQQYFKNNPQEALRDYQARTTQEFGTDIPNIVSADDAKFVVPGFGPAKSGSYHEPSSEFAKSYYRKLLDDPATKNKDVLITGGGMGAGKTTSLQETLGKEGTPLNGYAAINDTNLTNLSSAEQRIKPALESGRNVKIAYVYRDPVDAFVAGNIPRAEKTGRVGPITTHVDTHVSSLETIKKVSEKYKDNPRVEIAVIDNSRGRGNSTLVPIDFLKSKQYNKKELTKDLLYELEQAKTQGKVSEEAYQAYKSGLGEDIVRQSKSQYSPTQSIAQPGKQRGFLETVQESPTTTPELKQVAGELPQTYTSRANQELVEKARVAVETNYDDSVKRVKESTSYSDEDVAVGLELMGKAQREGRYNEALEIVDSLDKGLRESGRAVQAASIWGRMTPEGMLRFAKREVDKAKENQGVLDKVFGKIKPDLTPDDVGEITRRMNEINKMSDGVDKDNAVRGVMELINEKIPPGFSDKFDAYRYQNMLSNPRTQLRNISANLFNTMITKPTTLATRSGVDWVKAGLFGKEREAYIKEVPDYFKGLFNSWGDATEAMKGAWKGEVQNPDLMNLKAYRSQNLPKGLTVVPRAMESMDRFFQTLISSGEYAVQKSRGVADDVARAEAEKAAKYSLFRQAVDPTNKTGQGAVLSKIDQFTNTVTQAGRNHKSIRWFVPFINTPMNVTKQFVELSPAGFATLYKASGGRRDEQLAKALIGSTAMGLGAKLALDGNTTWSVPKNEKEREAFYAAGKKPFSVRIGDKWVPMITFGPFAYALGLPASIKDANDKAPLDASTMEKMTGAVTNQAKFFSQQTYVQGIANFVEFLSGEGDANLATSLGFTAGQVVPLQGLQRYVASVTDPVYRKKSDVKEQFMADIPGVSKSLEPYKDAVTGGESKRNLSDYVAPYSFGAPKGTGEQKKQIQAIEAFEKNQSKTSRLRTKTSEAINEALADGDRAEARQLAKEFNQIYTQAFKKWGEKYGDFETPEIRKEYRKRKIKLTRASTKSRLRAIKEKEKGLL